MHLRHKKVVVEEVVEGEEEGAKDEVEALDLPRK